VKNNVLSEFMQEKYTRHLHFAVNSQYQLEELPLLLILSDFFYLSKNELNKLVFLQHNFHTLVIDFKNVHTVCGFQI
jgi:hypothetical protein